MRPPFTRLGFGFGLTALVLVLTAVFLRLHGLDRSLWIDEAGSLAIAQAPDFIDATRHDVHPPLYYGVLRLGLQFTDSVALLRGFSVLCGLGLVAFGLAFGARSRFERLGDFAVFALLPGLIYHSQELRPYALLYLLFAVALWLAVRSAETGASPRVRWALAGVLLAAAATHQLTAFFLLSLVPLLTWPARRSGFRTALQALVPLAPAALATLALNRAYLLRPDQLPGGWWVPSATPDYTWSVLLDAAGWNDTRRFLAAVTRHMPGGLYFENILPLLAAVAVAGALAVSCAPWKRDPLCRLLAATAALYGAGLLTYSWLAESLVLTRTVLPLMIPLSLAIVRGLALQSHRTLRWGAAAILLSHLLAAATWSDSQALRPREDLRGLTAAVRTSHRSDDLLLLFPSLDFALRPYWKTIDTENCLAFDPPVSAPALVSLLTRVDQLPATARIQLVYRENFYFNPHEGTFPTIISELKQRGYVVTELWQRDRYVVLEARKP